jgi:hypothetical protein
MRIDLALDKPILYTRKNSSAKNRVDYEKIEQMITAQVQAAFETARQKRPYSGRNSPQANIKDYIRKQMEKRFGSSLYGFRLPQTDKAAENLKKKRNLKSPSEKKTFVEQLRKQNHEKFNELYSGLQEAEENHRNGSIMDLLFDQKVDRPKSAAKIYNEHSDQEEAI